MDRSTTRRLLDLMSRDIPLPKTLQDRLREHRQDALEAASQRGSGRPGHIHRGDAGKR